MPKLPKAQPKRADTRQQGRKTMKLLIDHALIELNKNGASKFDLEAVLRRSKTSKGSLYHHFGSKNGLIVAVETELIKSGLTSDNQVLRQMIEGCKSPQEFFSAVETVIRAGAGAPTREVRRQLIRSIAFAQHDKNLEVTLRETSIMGTQYFAETLAVAQQKGWLKNDIELTALAFWLQGMFIGQIMTDITDIETNDEDWVKIALLSLKTFINF
jgi:AcrR family transcriptional regulator